MHVDREIASSQNKRHVQPTSAAGLRMRPQAAQTARQRCRADKLIPGVTCVRGSASVAVGVDSDPSVGRIEQVSATNSCAKK